MLPTMKAITICIFLFYKTSTTSNHPVWIKTFQLKITMENNIQGFPCMMTLSVSSYNNLRDDAVA